MHHQPAWALWNATPHENDGHTKNGAQSKRETPAQIYRQQMGVGENRCEQSPECRADPPGTIDGQVRPTTGSRWNEFIDSRVNRSILSSNTGARKEAAGGEPDEVEREGGRDCGNEVYTQRHHKEELSPVPVGHATKEKCSQHGAKEIGRACT